MKRKNWRLYLIIAFLSLGVLVLSGYFLFWGIQKRSACLAVKESAAAKVKDLDDCSCRLSGESDSFWGILYDCSRKGRESYSFFVNKETKEVTGPVIGE